METDIGRLLLATVLEAKLRQEERGRNLRAALLAVYEATPGDPRFCVRRLEVVEHAARVLGIRVLNNAVFAEVQEAAREVGFEAIKNGNRALFRCVKRRDIDPDAALAESRTNRRDPRTRRCATQPASASSK